MKVESTVLLSGAASPVDELPIIKASEIKTILYLGLRGTIRPEGEANRAVQLPAQGKAVQHPALAVDTYA